MRTFKDINFNDARARIPNPIAGLCVFIDGELVHEGTFEDVLLKSVGLIDYEVEDTSLYFDQFIVRLKSPKKET